VSSYGYVFHPEAFADLDENWEYIAQDNIDAADRVLEDIHAAARTLAMSPHIGHRRPDLTARPLRFHVVRDQYLIAYAPRRNAA
jgi:plasmid stabilization system protein ParE